MSLVDRKKAVKWPRTWWLDHYLVFCIISVLINLEQHKYLLYCHSLQFGIVRVPCNNLRCECRATYQSPQSSPQGHSRPDSFSLPVSLSQNHSITHGFSVRTWMSDNNIKKIVSVFVKVCLGGENHLFPLKTRFYRVLLYSDTDMR